MTTPAPTPAPNPLAVELAAYAKLLPSLLDRQGQFALIIGDKLIDTYATWADACKAGYQTAGLGKPFLVKRIEETETANFFTRDLASCRTRRSCATLAGESGRAGNRAWDILLA